MIRSWNLKQQQQGPDPLLQKDPGLHLQQDPGLNLQQGPGLHLQRGPGPHLRHLWLSHVGRAAQVSCWGVVGQVVRAQVEKGQQQAIAAHVLLADEVAGHVLLAGEVAGRLV